MKKTIMLILCSLALIIFKATAQTGVTVQQGISSQESILGDVDEGLLSQYIQAARVNYPHVKLLESRSQSAKTSIPLASMSYFDIVNVSYIFRPNSSPALTVPGSTTANPYSVNGFQFTANFSLSAYLEKPFTVRKAKEDYQTTRYEKDEYLSTLGLEVRKRYYAYIQAIKSLKVLNDATTDAKIVAEKLRDSFLKGNIQIDTYTLSRTSLTAANTAAIQGEVNLLFAKDALEEIIGAKLETFKKKDQ
jgi:outer membrane protein TolC